MGACCHWRKWFPSFSQRRRRRRPHRSPGYVGRRPISRSDRWLMSTKTALTLCLCRKPTKDRRAIQPSRDQHNAHGDWFAPPLFAVRSTHSAITKFVAFCMLCAFQINPDLFSSSWHVCACVCSASPPQRCMWLRPGFQPFGPAALRSLARMDCLGASTVCEAANGGPATTSVKMAAELWMSCARVRQRRRMHHMTPDTIRHHDEFRRDNTTSGVRLENSQHAENYQSCKSGFGQA